MICFTFALVGGNQDRVQIMQNFTTPSITRTRMRVSNVAVQVDIHSLDRYTSLDIASINSQVNEQANAASHLCSAKQA